MNDIKRKESIITGLVGLIFICALYLSSIPKEVKQEEEIIIEEEPVIEEVIEEPVEEIIDPNTYDNYYVYCNNMDFKNLKEPGWFISYEDENYKSILGLDISEFNGRVNFYTLKDIGIDYVILRVGWRGSTEGGIYSDKYFEDYYAEAVDAGLNIGYYFFSQAVNEDEAKEEANFVLDHIKDKQCNMFVVFDQETSVGGGGRSDYLRADTYTSNAIAFLDVIKEAGYKPMIYTNLDWARNHYHVDSFEENDIPIWLAQYNGYPNCRFNYLMWQYNDRASIKGVANKGRTDLNLMLVKK